MTLSSLSGFALGIWYEMSRCGPRMSWQGLLLTVGRGAVGEVRLLVVGERRWFLLDGERVLVGLPRWCDMGEWGEVRPLFDS